METVILIKETDQVVLIAQYVKREMHCFIVII